MHLKTPIIIAVDGYSSCGKSTFAKLIAKTFNYIFIDTGAMYRAVALYGIKNNLIGAEGIKTDELTDSLKQVRIRFERNDQGNLETYLNDQCVEKDIRGIAVSEWVSEVSKIKEVRSHLVNLQQEMGKNKGLVMDGRDIGTVVFPNAEIKLFMTADPGVRAKRRYDELIAKGEDVSFEEIKKNVIERDHNDTTRKESPLKKADDAIVLDNSFMSIEEQMTWFNVILQKKGFLADGSDS